MHAIEQKMNDQNKNEPLHYLEIWKLFNATLVKKKKKKERKKTDTPECIQNNN